MKKVMGIIAVLISWINVAPAQYGVQLNTPEAMDGYTLVSLYERAVLVDNCGEIVHEWTDIQSASFNYKLLPNGNLLFIEEGHFHDYMSELTWDGDFVNQYRLDDIYKKYEIEILPNGNYLSVARRLISNVEADQMGFDTTIITPMTIDVVVEIDRNTGLNVWEWNIGDHMIQESDPLKNNYGIVKDNPQLLNIDAISKYDWTYGESFMINGMDYNARLDQIVLSIRKMSEFVIIDHSTTTEEAAGSSGGRQGKGGDILYRWGNSQNYGQGTEDDQQLYHQHNPNWIKYGPHKDKIIVFNNGLSRPAESADDRYSSADIIDTQVNSDGSYAVNGDGRFAPLVADVSYSKLNLDFNFFSGYLSGATVLENGNIFLTVGEDCRLLELNDQGDRVWNYRYINNFVQCFRAVKYRHDYPAFEGRELVPNGTIEPNNDYECELISSVDNFASSKNVNIVYSSNILTISTDVSNLTGQLIDINGSILTQHELQRGETILQIPEINPGIYIYHVISKQDGKQYSQKLCIY